jgi:peptidoglycan/LPS O-acetylase OafA/YrhL
MPPRNLTVPYRRDIDGLRAVSIIPVVLFHAGSGWVTGGFIGVDVFFVISGFLITQLLCAHGSETRLGLAEFYVRRIRRLLPAAIVMVLVITAVAMAMMLPLDLISYGRSLAAASLFFSNVFWWRVIDYFNPLGSDSLLLHTWSLSVEEQFYMVWPSLLLLGMRYLGHARFMRSALVLLLVSLLAGIACTIYKPNGAYFLSPFRAWELLLGAVLALGGVPKLQSRASGEVLGVAGLGAILWSALTFSKDTPFPGTAALAPCLGATAVIWSGGNHRTLISRVLELRPLVFCGVISYSLYLWHWPIFAIPSYLSIRLSSLQSCILVIVSIAAAILSWRFVEQPFRSGVLKSKGLEVPLLAFSIVFSLVALAAIRLSNGFPARFSADIVAQEREKQDIPFLRNPCNTNSGPLPPTAGCIGGARAAAPQTYSALLWGDSHADHYAPFLDEIGRREGFAFRVVSRNSCVPAVGLIMLTPKYPPKACVSFNETVLSSVLSAKAVTDVYLAAAWGRNFEEMYWATPSYPERSRQVTQVALRVALSKTIEQLVAAGKHVYVLQEVPHFPIIPLRCNLLRQAHAWLPSTCTISRSSYLEHQKVADAYFSSLASSGLVSYLRVGELLCDQRTCSGTLDGTQAYLDNGHLNDAGARRLAIDYAHEPSAGRPKGPLAERR